jgi:dsRNA-specific ribonuclease
MEVLIGGKILGQGAGRSKKAAEMEAARAAWEKLREKEALPASIPYLARDMR